MQNKEILAPCGSYEALVAAVRSGADAVYFGLPQFNARQNASNFDAEAQKNAARLCKLYGVKIYITLNTLLKDTELAAFQQALQSACSIGADAIILQDLGAIRMARTLVPALERHASTQMSVGTPSGLKLLEERGFARAVLPRELSLKETKEARAAVSLDFESFVHGALCMCVSGQCLLSAMLGSRSGNRGLCAQPCRLPFAAEHGTGHDLSLKDLSLFEDLPALSEAGVLSFKIEGRMKRPEYVAAAVTAANESLQGQYTAERKLDLENLFSRSGFTKGYFTEQLGKAMFGTRQKENVQGATNALLKSYAKLYEKPKAVRKIDFLFSAEPVKPASLTVKCCGEEFTVTSEMPCAVAEHRALDRETVEKQLKKCGGTVFSVGEIACYIKGNPSLPVSALNAMRRAALEKLESKFTAFAALSVKPFFFTFTPHIATKPARYIRFREVKEIPNTLHCDKIFLPLATDSNILQHYKAGVYLPRGIFGAEEAIKKELLEKRPPYALCDTLDAVAICKTCHIPVIGGPFLNLCNSLALEEAAELGVREATLSFECTLDEVQRLGGTLPRGLCVYGRTPLMLTRNCPIKNGKTCRECGRTSSLTDRKGMQFPVRCENGFSEIFNAQPTYMADRLSEIQGVDFHLFDFTTESRTEIEQILKAYDRGDAPQKGTFTRGLYYRGVK